MINSTQPLDDHYPIVVVGGGSVGLSLAAELGWRELSCLVVEERDDLNDHPRANAVANRTMEYYRRWGIDQAITDSGIPPNLPAEYLWVTSLHGREIHRVSLPPFDELVASRRSGGYANDEHSWSPYLKTIAGQNEVERVILDYIGTRDSVDFRFGERLLEFEDEGPRVRCRIENAHNGEVRSVTTDYLVACDGGRSSIRRELNIDYTGEADLASFISIYFRAPEMIKRHAFGHGNIFFPLHRAYRGFLLTWDEDCTYTYHLILDEGQQWQDIDPVAAINAVLGCDSEAEIISVQPWTAHALVAKSYFHGRAVLAGDAAHLFSPTGGFGMNTGVSDVIDIAWKLQALLEGWGGPRLLPSYEQERRPVGVRNTREAADCFHRLYAVMQNGDELDADDAAADVVREALKADIKDQEKLVASSGTLLGYRYASSDIVIEDGTPEPPDDARQYVPTARPGHRAPHAWLENGDALYDRFGQGFTLLSFGASSEEAGSFARYADSIGLPLEIVGIEAPEVAAIYESELVLIRPDLMVAWRKLDQAYDAEVVLDRARGVASSAG